MPLDAADEALIIFARKPEKGKVKTRLAASLGDEKALRIYIRLLEHTRSVAGRLHADTFVFLTEQVEDDFWNGFNLELQQGDDLGARMLHAFDLLFQKGYKKVVIIGSDCPGLNAGIVSNAFDALNVHDIAIGPAADGGYYLLGMNRLHPSLFENQEWSTAHVFDRAIAEMARLGLDVFKLGVLSDVDEASDVPPGWL